MIKNSCLSRLSLAVLPHSFSRLRKSLYCTLLLCSVCLIASGCLPRGETITLDESLEIAKKRYASALIVSKSKLPAEIAPAIESLSSGLDRLATVSSSDLYKQESKIIADTLKPLITKAGYTSRPALDEIVQQYAVAAEANSHPAFNNATAKLLAQRTYHLLSAELEATRFSL